MNQHQKSQYEKMHPLQLHGRFYLEYTGVYDHNDNQTIKGNLHYIHHNEMNRYLKH